MPQKRVWPDASPVKLSIVAIGSARLTMPELAAIRNESLSNFPTTLSPQLLRHSDEQTLCALVAVSKAMQHSALADLDFDNWAIVSSSRNLGRSAFAAVIDKYRTEGPWGVSVQVIPHCTAHAIAGTLSLALASHGPCIGAGSDANGELEALISVASILRRADWSGAWVVLSSWSPELAIDPAGKPTSDSICLAAAIAVTRRPWASSLGQIYIDAKPQPAVTLANEFPFVSLAEFLAGQSGDQGSWCSPNSSAIHIHVDCASDTWSGYSDRSLAGERG